MGLNDFTFYDLINRNAICFKNNRAWLDPGEKVSITFAEYKEKVELLAAGLQQSGIQKGDRVGVLGKNGLEYFLLYGASAALGAVMLPINWRLSAEETRYNLDDCKPRLLFVDREFQETVKGLKTDLPFVDDFYNLQSGDGDFSNFNALMGHGRDFERADVGTDDGFIIIHTAAVAGKPRGALLSHGNLLCANMHFLYQMNLGPQDVQLNILPLFHVGGLFITTAIFHAGALTLNMRKFDVEKALTFIQEYGISVMVEFPPILSSILEKQESSGADITSLKTAGGLDSPETIEKYQKKTGGDFYCLYGQTETSCLATFGRYNDKPGSAGRPIPLAEVVLVDDYDRPVLAGQTGEITMRGPMVFKGYWNLPEDNAYTFREGWHHTGDMGRFDEEGFLWYAGRKAEKELIKPGGENVYPAEVEKVILQHPAVEMTVVIGVPDPKWKEGIKAVCRLKKGETVDPEELIEFVGERIARFKKPHYVDFIDEFPLLEDGSIDRDRVKELFGK